MAGCGGDVRMPEPAVGDAMKYLLTGDEFNAQEALRMNERSGSRRPATATRHRTGRADPRALAIRHVQARIAELLGVDLPHPAGWHALGSTRRTCTTGVSGRLGGFISAHTQPTPDERRMHWRPADGVNLTLLPANTGLDYDSYVAAIMTAASAVETAGGDPFEVHRTARQPASRSCTSASRCAKRRRRRSLRMRSCSGEDDVPGPLLIPQAATKLRTFPWVACSSFRGWPRSRRRARRWELRASTWDALHADAGIAAPC